MQKNKIFSARHMLLLVIPPLNGLIIILLSFPQALLSLKFLAFLLLYSYSLGIPSILSIELLSKKVERSIPWLKYPLKRLILTFVLEVTVILAIFVLVNYLYMVIVLRGRIEAFIENTQIGLKYALISIVVWVLIRNSYLFFTNWRQSAINEKNLEKAKLMAEYEALRNQINPHFLFNSLSALSSLIYKDQKKAVNFVSEFSQVLRYVLTVEKKDVVSLASERKLLDSMIFLYHIRYEDDLYVNIRLEDVRDKYIVPMALQTLLENAIKHNEISRDKKLYVDIYEEDQFVTVKNNLQPKKIYHNSLGLGLENIKSRYQYLSAQTVAVEKTDDSFIVKVPILRGSDD